MTIRRKKTFKKVLIFILLYILAFGLIIFKIPFTKASGISYSKEKIISESEDDIYALLVEDIETALAMRIALIHAATETIDIAYYAITPGISTNIFYGALLKKANIGVKIRIIIDGLPSKSPHTDEFKAVASHPNITYAIYDPFNPLLIHRAHNTLHDKLIIVDNKYGLIGGRNISDRFLIDDNSDTQRALDRDVLLVSEAKDAVVDQMSEYYEELFSLDDNKIHNVKDHDKYKDVVNNLIASQQTYIDNFEGFNDYFDNQLENKIRVKNATFVRDPLGKLNKEPVIVRTIAELAQDYDDIFIQSPYFTSSRMLNRELKFLDDKNLTLLTNNITTNPNSMASSGYIRNRKKLARQATLYEFQHKNSIHAKTITMGNDISIIGSLNFDHRSVFLTTESMVVIYSEEFQESLNVALNDLLSQSLQVDAKGNYIDDETVELIEPSKIKILAALTMFINEML